MKLGKVHNHITGHESNWVRTQERSRNRVRSQVGSGVK